jgi:hypothetical protein
LGYSFFPSIPTKRDGGASHENTPALVCSAEKQRKWKERGKEKKREGRKEGRVTYSVFWLIACIDLAGGCNLWAAGRKEAATPRELKGVADVEQGHAGGWKTKQERKPISKDTSVFLTRERERKRKIRRERERET